MSTLPENAKYKIDLTFNPKDGKWKSDNGNASKKFVYDAGVVPEVITDEIYRVGYRFLGWGLPDVNKDQLFKYNGVMPFFHKTVEMVPAWKAMSNLRVNVITNYDNIEIDPINFQYGDAPTKPADPVIQDYDFLGWEGIDWKPSGNAPYTHYYSNQTVNANFSYAPSSFAKICNPKQ